MKKVVTFGDILVRLHPPGYNRFAQATTFEVGYTGAEANVCVPLSLWGCDTEFVTRLPENAIAECAMLEMNRYKVGTRHIARGGSRIGVYYVERGASQRPSKVVYDRMHSALCESEPGDYDWEKILDGADWFHFTGITPALGGKLPEICKEARDAAAKKGIPVSIDLNYRAMLWSMDDAQKVMRELVQGIDLLIGNEEDAYNMLGIAAGKSDVHAGRLDSSGYVASAETACREFGCKNVAYSLRTSISASDNNWQGMLYTGGQSHLSREYAIRIVDRVGGGDSFSAGLIYAMLHAYDAQKAIEFAVAASCLKHSIEHDFNLSTLKEVESLAAGNASGRVLR